MRHHLISTGVSILFVCACGGNSSDSSGGAAGSHSSNGGTTSTASGGSGVSSGGSATIVAGSASVAGSSTVGSGGTNGGIGGSAPSSGGSGGSAGKATGSAGGPASGGAGAPATGGNCTRDSLTAIVEKYQAAQTAGDKSKMPLSASATMTENMKSTTKGIWDTPLMISYRHDLLDTFACQTFSEVFVTEGTQQYVIGLRLAIKDGQISEIESIVTTGMVSGSTITSKDWNFDAQAYLTCAKSEDWSVVPEAQRNTREQLIAAGEAYFMVFSDKTTTVPWGMPCYRLEGGKGCTPAADKASQSCNVGVPDGINFKNTHWVVDLEQNTAVGLTLFGGASPDSHMFRLLSGKIVKVHTLTQGTGK
ncbi:MAG TPA: hypothetical protein VER96_19495 [Polyangiaceae bacterium]|nr:hypothetical protein [Polyangiaceae bacterium]